MAKMTKSQARKRLQEAMTKIFKVYGFYEGLSPQDANKLIKLYNELRPIKNRIK